jgi:predicted PurR-regulated permease PerM
MARSEISIKSTRFIMLASVCVVVAALYFGQTVLVPIALAILFSFWLAPLVHRLEQLKLPRAIAVLATVAVVFGVLAGIGYIVDIQLSQFSSDLPRYQQNIAAKVKSFRSGDGFLSHIQKAGDEVSNILVGSTTQPAAPATVQPVEPHVAIPLVSSEPAAQTPVALIEEIGSKLLGPVGTMMLVFIFTIFMLIQREDLRDRLIRLVGRSQLTITTQALDEAADRVSRYLLMQSMINGIVGIVVMISLWIIGAANGQSFPSPLLWGLLAALLRFIPYVGIWIAALSPLALSLAVFPGAAVAVEVLTAFVGIELLASQVIEPLMFGFSAGIGTLSVLVAAAFWTWLWGPIGLVLSTPMTVCLVVMGKYVPQLEFLNVLLGDEPALDPSARVYQRLLSLDQEEAGDLVAEYARQMPLEELYDLVLLPALSMAKWDRHRDNIEDDRHAFVLQGIREIVDELGESRRANPPPALPGHVTLPKGSVINVVCLPAHDEADEIVALMLAQVLEFRGYSTTTITTDQLASEMIATVERLHADAVCVSALPPAAVTHARYLRKRLRAKFPDIGMVAGLWTLRGDPARFKERLAVVGNTEVALDLRQAIDQMYQIIQPRLMAPPVESPAMTKS